MSSSTDIELLAPYEVIILDLDNTLYDESLYLLPVYAEVAAWLEKEKGLSRDEVYSFLENTYRENGFEKIYDRLFARFDIDKSHLQDCLEIQRNISLPGSIAPFERLGALVTTCLETGKKVYVLTNGHVSQQQNKVRQIAWNGLEKHIRFVYANDIAPKPSPDAVFHIIQQERTIASKILFIGDSASDKSCAERSGVSFLHVSFFLEEGKGTTESSTKQTKKP